MESNTKNKWQIRGAVLLIFLLGFLAGALALTIYHSKRPPAFSEVRRERFERMVNQLQLTPEQRTQVNQIMNEMRQKFVDYRRQSAPRVQEIRQQTDEQLQKVLTPDQWQQWQQMTRESRQRRP